MTRRSELQSHLADILEQMQARAAEAKDELLKIKTRQAQIEAELEAAKLALDRFSSFPLEVNGKEPCPQCWAIDGIAQGANTLANHDPRIDRYRCPRCFYEFELFAV